MNEPNAPPSGVPREARKWATIVHIIALVGLVGNGIGFLVAPLIVWLLKREDHPFIDRQGKEAVNFQITMFLALLAGAVLALVAVGIVIVVLVGLLMTVFPIIAAVKANEGCDYRYPLTIRLLK